MKTLSRAYRFHYSWWEQARINLASFVLGKALWGRVDADLRTLHIGAYLGEKERNV